MPSPLGLTTQPAWRNATGSVRDPWAALHACGLPTLPACGALLLQVDVTVNNILACINTKLLADYAAIDPRLSQLVRWCCCRTTCWLRSRTPCYR